MRAEQVRGQMETRFAVRDIPHGATTGAGFAYLAGGALAAALPFRLLSVFASPLPSLLPGAGPALLRLARRQASSCSSSGAKNFPVYERVSRTTSSGVPTAITSPPRC